jgi:predicted nucleotidyltransferase
MEKTIKIINELKKKKLIKDYVIGGGIATIFYVEPILTYDLDVFIIPFEKGKEKNLILLSPMFNYLEDKGYPWKGEHAIIEGVPVQFIPVDKLEEEAVRDAKEIEYEGVKTKVMIPEYLISVLLRAGRKKDIQKIEKLLEQTKIDMKKLKNILHRYGLSKKFDARFAR